MIDAIEQFIGIMSKADSAPFSAADVIADGEDHCIRLAKDGAGRKRLSYCLTVESDGLAHGNFTNHDSGYSGKWHSRKGDKSLTREERGAISAQIKAAEAAKRVRDEAKHAEAAKEAQRLWKGCKPAVSHPYLVTKGIQPHGARIDGDDLIIYGASDSKIVTYQRISPDGDKLFLSGGRKKGAYYPIMTAEGDKDVIVIVEGLATGASVREATGLPILVAFDAGNLKPVAQEMRRKYPEARIVLACDNDGGERNTGVHFGQQAALTVGGFAVWPDKVDTDWNDVHTTDGLDAVKTKILAVLSASVPESVTSHPEADSQPLRHDNIPPAPYEERLPVLPGEQLGDFGLPFKVLGYKEGHYYYYSFKQKEIIRLSAGSHTMMNLMQLATLDQWESLYLKAPQAKIPLYAANQLFDLANKRGYFKEEDRIRGTGVWKDAGRIIFNCGNRIYVDGAEAEFHEMNSMFVYVTGSKIPSLVDDKARDFSILRDILSMPSWENPASGVLLAGWIVIAPLCSALSFRPHIFITGQAASGKSTLMDIIRRSLYGISLNTDSTSSEASIRSAMGYNARPVIFDEAEGKGAAITSMDAVLSLARLASSGGTVMKFGQREFKAQSPFCFSAINPPIKNSADESRISRMVIKKNKRGDAQEHYKRLCGLIEDNLTPEFAQNLMSYTIRNIKTVMRNIDILHDILRATLKEPRAAQQISHMLAGWCLFGNNDILTEDEAREIVSMHDWSDHTAAKEESDPEKLLHYISLSIVRVNLGASGSKDVTLGDLISASIGKNDSIGQKLACDVLKNYSIKTNEKSVFIGNKNHNLSKLLKDTDWTISWARTLSDLEGTEKVSLQHFSSGDRQRCTKIPLKYFVDSEEPEFEEVEF